MTNKSTYLVRQKLFFITAILLCLMTLVGIVFITDAAAKDDVVRIYDYCFAWFGILTYIWCLWSWYKLRKELLCPYVVFFTVAFVFMFGQSFLTGIGVPIPRNDLRTMYPPRSILMADVFTVLGLTAFHLGAIALAQDEEALLERVESKNAAKTIKAMSSTSLYSGTLVAGWVLFLISIVPTVTFSFQRLVLALQYGYSFLYDPSLVETGLDAVFSRIRLFFPISLICLFIGASDRKFIRMLVFACTVMTVGVGFLTGGRGQSMVLITTALCMYHYLVRPIRGMLSVITGIAGVFLLSFMPVIYKLRSVIGRGLLDYFEAFISSWGKEGLLVQAISEMGGSMFPLINVMNLVPRVYSFRYGESYLYSLFTVIPNVGFWDVHPSAIKANLGNWLQQVLGLSYGPGFSAVAEAYINFGWAGIAFMFFLGMFYGRIFSLVKYEYDKMKYDPALLVLVFSVLSLTVMTNRNSFIGTVRAFAYYAIPVYLLCRACANFVSSRVRGDFRLSKRETGVSR